MYYAIGVSVPSLHRESNIHVLYNMYATSVKLKVPLSKIYSNTLHSTENMNCWNCWYGSLTINNCDSLKLYEKPF